MKITSVADFGPYNLLRNVAHGIQLVPPLIQTLIIFFFAGRNNTVNLVCSKQPSWLCQRTIKARFWSLGPQTGRSLRVRSFDDAVICLGFSFPYNCGINLNLPFVWNINEITMCMYQYSYFDDLILIVTRHLIV